MATVLQFPSTCTACPACGRKFATPKGTDKKLAQDIARAERAIAILEAYPADSESFREACQLEIVRLRSALINHSLLRSIYRRSDKATAYGISLVKAVQS